MTFEKLSNHILALGRTYDSLEATKTRIETFKNDEWVHDANDSDEPIKTLEMF